MRKIKNELVCAIFKTQVEECAIVREHFDLFAVLHNLNENIAHWVTQTIGNPNTVRLADTANCAGFVDKGVAEGGKDNLRNDRRSTYCALLSVGTTGFGTGCGGTQNNFFDVTNHTELDGVDWCTTATANFFSFTGLHARGVCYGDPFGLFVCAFFFKCGDRFCLEKCRATSAFFVLASCYTNLSDFVNNPVAFAVVEGIDFLLFQNNSLANRAFFTCGQTVFCAGSCLACNKLFGVRGGCNGCCFQIRFAGNTFFVSGACFAAGCVFVNNPFGCCVFAILIEIGGGFFGLF